MKRPENMDAAFDALAEWPSMTPRAVFYAGWEAALRECATSDARDAARYRWLRYPKNNPEALEAGFSEALDLSVDEAIAKEAGTA